MSPVPASQILSDGPAFGCFSRARHLGISFMRSISASGISDRSSNRSSGTATFSMGGKCSQTIREAARAAGMPPSFSSVFATFNEPAADLHKPDLNGVLTLADGPLDVGGASGNPVIFGAPSCPRAHMSDATGRTRWLGHRPGRQKLQAQSGRDRLPVPKLDVEGGDRLARAVFNLNAPWRGVVGSSIDDAPREDRACSGLRAGGVGIADVAELELERLQLPHGRCDTLRSGLSARGDHRPADLVLQLRESANQIGREIKPLRRCDACGRGIDRRECRPRPRHHPKLRYRVGHNS